MRKIYITALFLLGLFIVPLGSSTSAASFKDVGSTHWAYKEISFYPVKELFKGIRLAGLE